MGDTNKTSERRNTVASIKSGMRRKLGDIDSGGMAGPNDAGIVAYSRETGIPQADAFKLFVQGARAKVRAAERGNKRLKSADFGAESYGQTADNVRRMIAAAPSKAVAAAEAKGARSLKRRKR